VLKKIRTKKPGVLNSVKWEVRNATTVVGGVRSHESTSGGEKSLEEKGDGNLKLTNLGQKQVALKNSGGTGIGRVLTHRTVPVGKNRMGGKQGLLLRAPKKKIGRGGSEKRKKKEKKKIPLVSEEFWSKHESDQNKVRGEKDHFPKLGGFWKKPIAYSKQEGGYRKETRLKKIKVTNRITEGT